MIITADGMKYSELREEWTPAKMVEAHDVLYTEWLMETKPACVSFKETECAKFDGPGSFVVLDFGKELCGGIRMITRDANGPVKWRLTFGESLTEAYSSIGENGYAIRGFWDSFKLNFKQATLGWSGILVVFGVFTADFYIFYQSEKYANLSVALLMLMAIVVVYAIYLFAHIGGLEREKERCVTEITHLFSYISHAIVIISNILAHPVLLPAEGSYRL